MSVGRFRIQDTEFEAPLDPREGGGFGVRSVPRAYRVEFPEAAPGDTVAALLSEAKHPLLIFDRRVAEAHFPRLADGGTPCFAMDAREEDKEIATVLRLVEFLEKSGATRGSMLVVVGGGIVQDVSAFAAAMYKRGVPWTFVATTLLAQGDSSIGAKSALNHRNTKNLLGLFSAPRRVVLNTGFLRTLTESEYVSGMGEIFRLHVTGGEPFVEAYERDSPAALAGDQAAIRRLLVGALSVKRAVIEVDEYEVDLRRALNYGHSFGHALEAMVQYRIPHGTAVAIGMMVENEIASRRGIFGTAERDRIERLAAPLVLPAARRELAALSTARILELLRNDKKTEGDRLKLVIPERIGAIRFIDFKLDAPAAALVADCIRSVNERL